MDREYDGREPDQPRGHLAVERGEPLEAPVEAVAEGHEKSRQGDGRAASGLPPHLELGCRAVQNGWTTRAASCRDKRSEEHTSELQSLMRIPYAGFCLTKNTIT